MPVGQAAIRLGVFTLDERIARGGMASVWRGAHALYGTPVAIKVLTSDVYRESALVDALQDEVRAVAGLRHPNIIWVHDAGTVDRTAERRSGGALLRGSPWYAMDLLHGGTLAEHSQNLQSFEPIRALLLDLLDALAHAHSRGVLHRDLKPGNLLFTRAGELQLADFGMALSMADNAAVMGGGTPAWIAPEQIEGALWNQGPWTDLYAVGCLAWAMVCGHQPYEGKPRDVLTKHFEAPIPRLLPRFGVPTALQGWLEGMMAKHPDERFQRAADAARALFDLPRTYTHAPATELPADFGLKAQSEPTIWLDRTGKPVHVPTSPPPTSGAIPKSWHGRKGARTPLRLLGAGLGLYGLRSIPLVGRHAERDALWAALREAKRTNSPRIVVLRGPAGFGKSRLARWLCHRAHEVGAAEVFRATHNPQGSPQDGFQGLIARCCRTEGVADEDLFAHLRARTAREGSSDPDWDAATLRQLARPVRPADAPDELVVRFGSAREVHRAVLRRMQQQRRSRVALVWLDDVQWGLEALAFLPFLLEQQDAGAVMLVLCAQNEALAEHPTADGLLRSFRDRVLTLRIGPLAEGDRPALLQNLLPLAPDVQAEVDERTAGNALFATQLVGDWVERGLLQPGLDGFGLRGGADLPLPRNLASMWSVRVARLLESGDPGWRDALELAAVLGHDIDDREWAELCARAGADRSGLVHRLVSLRLAVRHERGETKGWSFVHGMLREAVLDAAHGRGVTRALHDMVIELLASGGEEAVVRRAHHLEKAGRFDEAIDAWSEARRFLFSRDRRAAEAALDRVVGLLTAHGAASDPRWARARLRLIERELRDGRPEQAREIMAKEQARGGPAAMTTLALAESRLADAAGDSHTALTFAERACRHSRGLDFWHAEAQEARSTQLGHAGRVEEAAKAQLIALRLQPRPLTYQHAIFLLCATGAMEEGAVMCAELAELAADLGTPGALERAQGASALLAATRGDLQAAAEGFRNALELRSKYGDPVECIHRLNLVEVLLMLGEAEQAREVLEPLLQRGARPRSFNTWTISALDLSVAAHTGDWERFDAVALSPASYKDRDQGNMLLGAGDLAMEAGHWDRARRAWELALSALEGADDELTEAARRRLR